MTVVIGAGPINTTDTAELGQVVLSAGFDTDGGPTGTDGAAGGGAGLGVTAAAVAIRIHGGLTTAAGGARSWALVKELAVYGTAVRTALVQLTGTYPPASVDEYYAPEAAALLRDASFGEPSVLKLDAGNVTETEAKAIGRAALRRMLLYLQRRTYTVEEFDAVPQLGQTVQMPDGFTGVCWECGYSAAPGGKESLKLTLVNLAA
jgi:hypothetical protein